MIQSSFCRPAKCLWRNGGFTLSLQVLPKFDKRSFFGGGGLWDQANSYFLGICSSLRQSCFLFHIQSPQIQQEINKTYSGVFSSLICVLNIILTSSKGHFWTFCSNRLQWFHLAVIFNIRTIFNRNLYRSKLVLSSIIHLALTLSSPQLKGKMEKYGTQ